jgi:hypothetical protein
MMRVLPWLILSVFLPVSASAAKHAIVGQIVDRNGAPVDKAIITLRPSLERPLTAQLVTDREGRFLIDYLRNENGERAKLARKVEYTLEVYKPGYHVNRSSFSYRKGEHVLDVLRLTEDTITIRDDEAELDPEQYEQQTHSSGANYEGQ